MEGQALQHRLKTNFTEPLIIPAAELQDWLRRDAERWGVLARESGIRAD